MQKKISVVINTKNSDKTLEKTLKSVKDLADEIIVVDMKSTDKTANIAKKYKAKVFEYKDVGYVEPARNFAISKAENEWILILDSDEELTPGLVSAIKELISQDHTADAYHIARKNMIFGKWIKHTGWWPDFQLRFFRKGYVQWKDEIHAIPETFGEVKYLAEREDVSILHHNYETVSDYLKRMDRYTDIQKSECQKSNVKCQNSILDTFLQEFLSRYFAREGYEDGTHGEALSILQATAEAVVVMKLKFNEELRIKNEEYSNTARMKELRQFQKDLNYWIADYYVSQSSGIKKLLWRIRRKIKI